MLTACLVVLSAVSAIAAPVTITAHYPDKLPSLYIRGDGCGLDWETGLAMTASAENEWTGVVECGNNVKSLDVKVLVGDKTWMLGANHHVNLNDSNSSAVYPWFYNTKGTLEIIENVYSSELKNTRDVIVYKPPSYAENTLKVHKNVLIMHDGQNLFDPRTSAFGAWMCQDALDASIIGGTTEEILVVGAYNTVDRNDEYTYVFDPSEGFGGKGDLYLDWIESTLLPLVPQRFRVTIERDSLGILGSSLGGLISCYAAWTRSAVYGRAGCMSSSFWWDENDYQKNVITGSQPPKDMLPVIYMDSGDGSKGERDCGRYTQEIYDYELSDCGYSSENTFTYVMPGGTHDEASWGERFHIPIEKLYPA
jgi:predicted alpha/beta superfamily hydrolase